MYSWDVYSSIYLFIVMTCAYLLPGFFFYLDTLSLKDCYFMKLLSWLQYLTGSANLVLPFYRLLGRLRRSLILGDREVVAYDRGICYFSPPIRTSSVGVFLKCIGLNLNAGFRQLVWSLLGMFGGVRQSSGFVLLGQYITGAWGSTVSSGILLFCMG